MEGEYYVEKKLTNYIIVVFLVRPKTFQTALVTFCFGYNVAKNVHY